MKEKNSEYKNISHMTSIKNQNLEQENKNLAGRLAKLERIVSDLMNKQSQSNSYSNKKPMP